MSEGSIRDENLKLLLVKYVKSFFTINGKLPTENDVRLAFFNRYPDKAIAMYQDGFAIELDDRFTQPYLLVANMTCVKVYLTSKPDSMISDCRIFTSYKILLEHIKVRGPFVERAGDFYQLYQMIDGNKILIPTAKLIYYDYENDQRLILRGFDENSEYNKSSNISRRVEYQVYSFGKLYADIFNTFYKLASNGDHRVDYYN